MVLRLTVLVLALVAPTAATAAGFTVDLVDSTGSVGLSASLAVDGAGRPHIAYIDAGRWVPKYATRSGDAWRTETVDARGGCTCCVSLALDSRGVPHVAWFDDATDQLVYATRLGASWSRTEIAAGGLWVALDLDLYGTPHVVHSDAASRLHYATLRAGRWVDTSLGWTGEVSSLALDRDREPHVASQSGGVQYLERMAGSWRMEGVDPRRTLDTSIAVAADARVHVAYVLASGVLVVATRGYDAWVAETVASSGARGVSIALDREGRPHLSYVAYGRIHHAVRSAAGWTSEPVDVAAQAMGRHSSIAVDGADGVHIAYYDASRGDLKYAFTPAVAVRGGDWTGVKQRYRD